MSTTSSSGRPEPTTRTKARFAGTRTDDRSDTAFCLAPRFSLASLALSGVDLVTPHALALGRSSSRRKQKEPLWVSILAEGCRLATELPPRFRISLPVESPDSVPEDLLAQLASVLCAHNLAAPRLELEFTETSLTTDSDALFYSLAILRDIGVGLVLAGFGTGVTSLSLLRDRSFAGLITDVKLDRHLFMHENPLQLEAGRSIARSVVQLGTEFGLRTRAEGVDTAEILSFLQTIGCQEGRGTALGKPQSLPDFLSLSAGGRKTSVSRKRTP
ncbi:EAL domain-containing protein [Acetobacter conturbans]|uniref:EAL domain-containing protein n=1 Tax=Acetobacter conturbans TaxID=1737472 RepID=A0ABX0JZV5_9PROT|nr:EAL domain-containing protein [Acetobacter conturbans]NHN88886.1 EAL domain-containing protein [Acetobacter conturbans]